MNTQPNPDDPARIRALAIVTHARAVADYRLRPSDYADLAAAIAADDLDAMEDQTHDVRVLLHDKCAAWKCHEWVHDGSEIGPLDEEVCSERCYQNMLGEERCSADY